MHIDKTTKQHQRTVLGTLVLSKITLNVTLHSTKILQVRTGTGTEQEYKITTYSVQHISYKYDLFQSSLFEHCTFMS